MTSKSLSKANIKGTIFSTYSQQEERLNTLTHGISFLIAVIASILLIKRIPDDFTTAQTLGVYIYCLSLLAVFLTSTLYHGINRPVAKQVLKRLDHCVIFVFIAGTYTPILTIAVQTPLADVILSIVWIMALIGVVFKAFFTGRYEAVSVMAYLAMGWIGLLAIYQVYFAVGAGGFTLLLTGGILYTIGVIFYVEKRIPYNHAIWHIFVSLGAAAHFWMTLGFV